MNPMKIGRIFGNETFQPSNRRQTRDLGPKYKRSKLGQVGPKPKDLQIRSDFRNQGKTSRILELQSNRVKQPLFEWNKSTDILELQLLELSLD